MTSRDEERAMRKGRNKGKENERYVRWGKTREGERKKKKAKKTRQEEKKKRKGKKNEKKNNRFKRGGKLK